MADTGKKPTRRKRLTRKEARAIDAQHEAHAGTQPAGTLQPAHRPSVNEPHGKRRRHLKARDKAKTARISRNAAAAAKVAKSEESAAFAETAAAKLARTQDAPAAKAPAPAQPAPARPASGTPAPALRPQTASPRAVQPAAKPQAQTAPQARPAAASSSQPDSVAAAHAEAVAAACRQGSLSAVETQIPSLAPNFDLDVMEQAPTAEQATAAGQPAEQPIAAAGQQQAVEPQATASAPEMAQPAQPVQPADHGDAAAVAAAAAQAVGAAAAPEEAAAKAQPAQAAADAADKKDAAAEDKTAAPQGAKKPSVAGKRVANPDIVDHVALRARRKKRLHKMLVIAIIVVALIAVVGGLFAWQRWFRYDDSADIQGTWQLNANKDQTVVIDGTNIDLVKGVSYKYTLNTHDKTIQLSFSDKNGSGTYHFNGDRTVLVINEGSDQPNILVQLGLMDDPAIENDTLKDDVTVLTKVSNDTSTHYSDDSSSSSSTSTGTDSGTDTAATTSTATDAATAENTATASTATDSTATDASASSASSSNG